MRLNIEQNGWDGEWYRRAYFDDGSPLGSASNPECQIDSIAQSWAVLSGAGDVERSRMAMGVVDTRLVRREDGLIQLLDPPFDKSPLNPGYIKGYVPGVRENGGQYTHGAIWAVMAFAASGQPVNALAEGIREAKKVLIERAIEQANGNYTEAAKILGIRVLANRTRLLHFLRAHSSKRG